MSAMRTASERIIDEVTSWPGVEAAPGSRGELSLRLGPKELGHLHGDHALHTGFPKGIWHELYEQGRIDYHPVFPGKPGYASRRIESADDVRDAIELLRLNYDRARARQDLPAADANGSTAASGDGAHTPRPRAGLESPVDGLYASTPQTLPFAPTLDIRAFLLRRDAGNLLIYSTETLGEDLPAIEGAGGVARRYLNHSHEAMFATDAITAPLFVHERERESVNRRATVRATFAKRHTLDGDFEVIPTPGHTPGATAYLWDTGRHRLLFTGDTIYLNEGEWVEGLLDSSNRDAFIASLELIGELDFDVLVPWASTHGQPYHAVTSRADATRRIGAMLDRLKRGESG